MDRFPQRGDVYVALLPSHQPPGHEQLGARPVVIVGRSDKARFPMVVAGEGTYPVLSPGQAGLTLASAVLLEHIQGLDERRLIRLLGHLTPDEMRPIQAGIMGLIGGQSIRNDLNQKRCYAAAFGLPPTRPPAAGGDYRGVLRLSNTSNG